MIFFLFFFFLMIRRPPRSTLFPTRRSSDLGGRPAMGVLPANRKIVLADLRALLTDQSATLASEADRKSTRLNSSHSQISYAVFCLKKKKIEHHVGHEIYTDVSDSDRSGRQH